MHNLAPCLRILNRMSMQATDSHLALTVVPFAGSIGLLPANVKDITLDSQ